MFDLSRAGYYADFRLMPVVMAVLLVMAAGAGIAVSIGAGFLIWTLAEYLVHRFVFHRVPWLRREHDRHHREPAAYIGASSAISLSLLAGLWAVSHLAAGSYGDAAMFGFVAGYTAYIVAHDRFHHGALRPASWFYPAFHRHAIHHRGVEANFGVIVPWWDVIFRTYRR